MTPPPSTTTDTKPSTAAMIAGAVILAFVVVFLCLIPKPENDLFFELRIGTDILRTGHLPHVDTYSWTNRGAHWDVPEWLSFVVYALAYRYAGFYGVFCTMTAVLIGCVWTMWWYLAPRLGFAWSMLLTNLTALALSDYIQERPYIYTYLFLASTLAVLGVVRQGRSRIPERDRQGRLYHDKIGLWLLPLLCAVWTNLHQGVIVFVCVIFVYAFVDIIRRTTTSMMTLATAVGCALASMVSPYGWNVYTNVFVTLRDHTMMSNVTEWNSIAVLPFAQMQAFLMIAALTAVAIAINRKRDPVDIVVLAAVFIESLLHARNTALFAIASTMIGAPHFGEALGRLRGVVGATSGRAASTTFAVVGVLYLMAIAAVGTASLRRYVGSGGYSLEGIGEAVARVPSYPAGAVDFVKREGFPSNLRVFNNFAIGGYLMWALPSEPDFVDGRLDVFTGPTFDDMLVIARHPGTPAWETTVRKYDFDCVITTTPKIATAFAHEPEWALVYVDPPRPHQFRGYVLLRRTPRFAALIARSTSVGAR